MLDRIYRRAMLLIVSMAASIVAGRFFLTQLEREREKRELLTDVEIIPKPVAPAAAKQETPAVPMPEPKEAVKKEAIKTAPVKSKDDLTIIEGIGPAYARALNTIGIHSFADLAAQKAANLVSKLQTRVSVERVRDWIKQAKQLTTQ